MANFIMANTILSSLYWKKQKEFNNKSICSECKKNGLKSCVIDQYYEPKNITKCSGFEQKPYPYDVNKVANKREKEPKIEPWFIKNITPNMDNYKYKSEMFMNTPRSHSKSTDFYEQYFEQLKEKRNNKINNLWENHLLLKAVNDLEDKEKTNWHEENAYVHFDKKDWKEFKNKIRKIRNPEFNIWEKIKNNKTNKKEDKNMNKTNSTKIEILKDKIEKIKEERQKYIDYIKRIYGTDSCLRDDYNGISRKYINYILKNVHPFTSTKKINKLRSYIILDHLNLKYKTPEYYNNKHNNPLSMNYFNLIDAKSEDWKTIKNVLNMFKVYAEEYIKAKYEVDLKLISDKNDSIICEQCGTVNTLKSNYCNNCGKDL